MPYMHTLNGEPARFDGEQIIYARSRRPVPLATSLAQIRREQRATRAFRRRIGIAWLDARHPVSYGYRSVSRRA